MTYKEFCEKYSHLSHRDLAELWEDFCIESAAREIAQEEDTKNNS